MGAGSPRFASHLTAAGACVQPVTMHIAGSPTKESRYDRSLPCSGRQVLRPSDDTFRDAIEKNIGTEPGVVDGGADPRPKMTKEPPMISSFRFALILAALSALGMAGAHGVVTAPSAEAKSCKWTTTIPDPTQPWIQYHTCSTRRP